MNLERMDTDDDSETSVFSLTSTDSESSKASDSNKSVGISLENVGDLEKVLEQQFANFEKEEIGENVAPNKQVIEMASKSKVGPEKGNGKVPKEVNEIASNGDKSRSSKKSDISTKARNGKVQEHQEAVDLDVDKPSDQALSCVEALNMLDEISKCSKKICDVEIETGQRGIVIPTGNN